MPRLLSASSKAQPQRRLPISRTARRLLQVPVQCLAVLTLLFLLVHLAPGDPATALGGEFADDGTRAELLRHWGLDRPLAAQYAVYLGRLVRLDLGVSYTYRAPVLEVILEHVPASLVLFLPSLLLSAVLAAPLGALLARRRGRPRAVALAGSVVLDALPVFWLAQLLALLFAYRLGWFPVQGMSDARSVASGLGRAAEIFHHALLPIAALTLQALGLLLLLVLRSCERAATSGWLIAARARGLSDRRIRLGHLLPNALSAYLTTLGGRLAGLFAGAVLVETVFAWPGLGSLFVAGMSARDYPLLLGLLLLITASVVVANLLTDLTVTRVDPRTTLG